MEIGELIRIIAGTLKKNADNKLRESNLTIGQVSAILTLSRAENHTLSFKELERRTHTSQPVNVGIISRLEEKGFVKTNVNPDDRRDRYAILTEKGLSRSNEAEDDIEASTSAIFSVLSEDERTELKRILSKVCATIK